MLVEIITHAEAAPFIEKWHYSARVPTGGNRFFGWHLESGDLYAVANYGIGVNPYIGSYLSRITGFPVQHSNLVELKRLCRVEPRVEDQPLTKFLAECHRRLRASGIEYVVSFSDPAHGHSGGVYKAANFQHLGKTNPEVHVVDKDGVVRHRRYAYRYARRHDITINDARIALGLLRKKTQPKDRWFLVINRRAVKKQLLGV